MNEQVLPETDIDKNEIDAAKWLIKSLLLLLKTYGLYSERHPFCEKTLKEFHTKLLSFLEEYDSLLLHVEKRRLLYEGEEVLSGPANEENLAFSFFRDGIEWIEILEGIELWETSEIIKTLHTYKRLPEEAEGDIVTAFWESELPHLRYEASEFIPDEGGQNTVNPVAKKKGDHPEEEHEVDLKALREFKAMAVDGTSAPLAESNREKGTVHPENSELTPKELENVNEMLIGEEEVDFTQEILHMLSDILKSLDDEKFFALALKYLKISVEEALLKSHYDNALKILQTVHYLRGLCQKDHDWALKEIEAFLNEVSEPDFIELLRNGLIETETPHLQVIKKILLFLSPESIGTLAHILVEIESAQIKEMLIEVITTLAQQDCSPIEPLLKDAPDDLLLVLIGVLGHVSSDSSQQLLFTLHCHRSEIVRKVVLRTLINKKVWNPESFFTMVEDESTSIRKTVLDYLGSKRCENAENLFINYLKKGKVSHSEPTHLVACFKALGSCGSKRSIPFLQELLLGGNVLTKLLGSPSLQGAGIALSGLGTQEAWLVLQKAGGSFYPGVRRSVRELIED
jgi:HEAT repeat protein